MPPPPSPPVNKPRLRDNVHSQIRVPHALQHRHDITVVAAGKRRTCPLGDSLGTPW